MAYHTNVPAIIFGLVIIGVVLLDAFETVVLPRRVTRKFRLTAWFYRRTWVPWRKIAGHNPHSGPAAKLPGILWAAVADFLDGVLGYGLIAGFGLLQYGIGGHKQLGNEPITFARIMYHSGETFFTLGYGDIVPTRWGALLVCVRSRNGFCISRRGHWISAGGLRFIFTAGNSDFYARCPRGIALPQPNCWCGWPEARRIRRLSKPSR